MEPFPFSYLLFVYNGIGISCVLLNRQCGMIMIERVSFITIYSPYTTAVYKL